MIRTSNPLAWLAAAALLAPQPALAEAGQSPHWAVPLRAQIARVNAVDWKLASLAAPRCAAIAAGTGLALDSLAAYPASERAAIAAALGIGGGVVVAAVAPGSPAAEAKIEVGEEVAAIGARPVSELAGDKPELVAESVADALAALEPGEPVTLTLARGGATRDVQLVPTPRCAARSILAVDDHVDAYSDARNLALTTGLVDFVDNDDELALLAGHELAHIVLGPELEKAGIRNKRKEAAADKLGAELAACAGYDIALASRFWDRFDSTRFLGFLPTLTHPRSKTRRRDIAAMAGSIDCSVFAPAPPAAQTLP